MSSEAAVFSTGAIGGTYPPFFTVSALPGKLERRFEKEEHLYQFMAGSVRFGLLQQYRKMEGGRRDETEGRAAIRWRAASPELLHNAEYTGLSFEPYYVLCASHPEACECAVAKFGRFVVSINDPVELLRRIVDAWEHHGRYSSPAFITPVLYNKGDLVEPPPYYIAQPCLVYAQKPADLFSAEREYRYSLQAKHTAEPDPYLTLYVPCNDICTLVTE